MRSPRGDSTWDGRNSGPEQSNGSSQTTLCVRRDIRIAEVNDPHGALTAMGGADALKAKIQYSDGSEA